MTFRKIAHWDFPLPATGRGISTYPHAMEPAEYHKMKNLEQDYWWHQGRRSMVLHVIDTVLGNSSNPRCLDVGCGTGMLTADLAERGTAFGADFSPIALKICKDRNLSLLARADGTKLPYPDGTFDLITALDLVEHVEDDSALLREFNRVLKPGGTVIITVPAHPSLWSDHDLALHHFRRYRRSQLLSVLSTAGLEPTRISYAMALAFLAAAPWRTFSQWRRPSPKPIPGEHPAQRAAKLKASTDEFPIPKWANTALLMALRSEARILKTMNLPFGLSLLATAKRPAK